MCFMETWAVALRPLSHHFISVFNKGKEGIGHKTDPLRAHSFSLRIVSKCFRRTHQLWIFGHQVVLEGDKNIKKDE